MFCPFISERGYNVVVGMVKFEAAFFTNPFRFDVYNIHTTQYQDTSH